MTDTTTLIQRLREDLPKVNEPESQFSCVATPDIRQAADALEQQAAQIAEKDAEIARVTAELEALKGDLDPLFKDLADYGEEIEALRADAERYRWLRMRLKVREQRSMSGRYKDSIYIRVAQSFFDTPTRGDDGYLDKAIFAKECCEFDAAIDAALRQEQPT